jgi:hypothetical protein
MTRMFAAWALAAVVLAGCGSTGQGSGDGSSAAAEPTEPTGTATAVVEGCEQSEDGFVITRNLAEFDVDGNGSSDRVGLVEPTRAGCPPLLAVDGVAGTPGPGVSAEIPSGGPPVRSAFGVAVPGRQGALVVTQQFHPRGGFQLRLFGLDDGVLSELVLDGHPLLPFVALDVQEHPLSADCAAGGVVVTEALPHRPAGVAFAWDVRRTTYAVTGDQVARRATTDVAKNVLPDQLGKSYPELVKQQMFRSCRTG